MLHILRGKRFKKAVFWSLVVLVMPAFVLWGTGSMSGSKDKLPSSVGTIDGKRISFDELTRSINAIRCQVILNYFPQPEVLDSFLKNRAFLARIAWDRLIMLENARAERIEVSNKEVIEFIRTHPLFLRGGAFDERLYGYVLRNNFGLEPRMFEELTRENLEIKKLNDIVGKDVTATDDDARAAFRAENDKLKIAYVSFDGADFLDKVSISDDVAKDYFETHRDDFAVPQAAAPAAAENATTKTETPLAPAPQEPPVVPTETASAAPRSFADAKADVVKYLSEREAKLLALKHAEGVYKVLYEAIDKEKLTFEAACAKQTLKIRESALFGRKDYLEGIGEAALLVDLAVRLKENQPSGLIETRKGALFFKVIQSEKLDEEKFSKEKADYLKKVVDVKKNRFLEQWLRTLSVKSTLNINPEELEKYYK